MLSDEFGPRAIMAPATTLGRSLAAETTTPAPSTQHFGRTEHSSHSVLSTQHSSHSVLGTQYSALVRACAPEFVSGFGVPEALPGRALLESLCWPLAGGLARLALEYDARVAKQGLCGASEWLLRERVQSVLVAGGAAVPA